MYSRKASNTKYILLHKEATIMGKKLDLLAEGFFYALANANRMTPPVVGEYLRRAK